MRRNENNKHVAESTTNSAENEIIVTGRTKKNSMGCAYNNIMSKSCDKSAWINLLR